MPALANWRSNSGATRIRISPGCRMRSRVYRSLFGPAKSVQAIPRRHRPCRHTRTHTSCHARPHRVTNLHPQEIRAMNQGKSNVGWIGTYMEWTNSEDWAFGSGAPAHSDMEETNAEAIEEFAIEEFAASYLDWGDSRNPTC